MKRLKNVLSVYGWLILAMIFLYLSGGDRPVEIAVWLSPFLILRFFREVKLWKGILFTWPLMAAITLLADKGMMPFPLSIAIILTVINTVIALIPYLIDRLLSRSLPLSLKTLLFPTAAVAVEALIASYFTGGTWGNPAYGIKNMPLLQLVSVTGIWGMMFLIYWIASVVNEVWEHRHKLGDIRKFITASLTVLIIVYGFGLWRLHYKKPPQNVMRVAGITPGPGHRAEMMEIFGKLFSPKRNELFDTETIRTSINEKFDNLLSESSRMAESGVEMVVWSEVATIIFERDEDILLQSAVHSVRKQKYFLGLALAILKDDCLDLVANSQPFVENKLLLISPQGDIDWEYLKWNLAPGYERTMTIQGDGRLKSATTVKGTVTGAICYDMDFPQYIRQQ